MTAEMKPGGDLHDPRIAFGPLHLDPRAIIYSTILMLTAVALVSPGPGPFTFDEFVRAGGLLLAPLFAISMAHGFSEAIDLQIRLRRPLTWADRRHLIALNLQYMVIGVIAWATLLVPLALQWSVDAAVWQLYILGVLSLAGWGAAAAHHGGLPRRRQIMMGINYGVVGMLIVTIEVVLKH